MPGHLQCAFKKRKKKKKKKKNLGCLSKTNQELCINRLITACLMNISSFLIAGAVGGFWFFLLTGTNASFMATRRTFDVISVLCAQKQWRLWLWGLFSVEEAPDADRKRRRRTMFGDFLSPSGRSDQSVKGPLCGPRGQGATPLTRHVTEAQCLCFMIELKRAEEKRKGGEKEGRKEKKEV